MICICIGNVYSVFPTLKIIQNCLTRQNDNRSFRVQIMASKLDPFFEEKFKSPDLRDDMKYEFLRLKSFNQRSNTEKGFAIRHVFFYFLIIFTW
jgi:hypothetical protein